MKIPIITVMIQARTPERVFELIDKGLSGGADAFGFQNEQLEECYRTKEVYSDIFRRAEGKSFYITNYANNQNEGKSDEALAEELLKIADLGGELFDIRGDMFASCENQVTYDKCAVQKQKALIERLHGKGKRVLMSSHTNKFMTYEEVKALISEHKLRGADVAKIVSISKSEKEEISSLETSARLAAEGATDHLFLTSGEFCKIHRRATPFISGGMFLCVAEHDELATKAQPLLADAKKLMKLYNEEW